MVVAVLGMSDASFKIYFNSNNETEISSLTTDGSSTIAMPDNPTRGGYIFDGWYYDNGIWKKPFTANSLINTPISSDMTIYAKWIVLNTLNLTNDNETAGIVSGSGEYATNANVTITAVENNGYDFDGWFNESNTLISNMIEYTFIMPENDITITAKWTIILKFTLNITGTEYSVSGINETDKTIITIPSNYNGLPVTVIDVDAFYDCISLTNIVIPDSIISIGDSAFSGCSGLAEITLPFVGASETATDSSALFGYIFGIDSYTGSTAVEQYYSNTSSTIYYIPSSLAIVTINGGTLNLGAFSNCIGLTSITMPNSVTSIEDYAFYGCTALTNITIGDNVASIGFAAFYGCTALINITIGESVTNIGDSAFRFCRGLTSITIPNSVTNIGDYALYGCTALTSITIPNSVTSIGNNAFSNCIGLTNVTIGNSVTSIGYYVFYGCTALTSITIPNSVTSIVYYAFYYCSGLTSVTFTNTTGWYVTKTENATSGTNITVTDTSLNATYLKSTYRNYYWYRK